MNIQGVIMDWAGTAVDYGCLAPVQVFTDIFREIGLDPTLAEVRAPMGMLKIEHIRTMLAMPRLQAQFQSVHHRLPAEADILALHESFEPKLLAILPDHAEPIVHVIDTVAVLRERGLKIGSTTGYNDVMMDIVTREAKKRGYAPDYWLTPESVRGRGRPYPYMIYANMIKLDMGLPQQVVKVGDTVSDMQEARQAGVWAIGVLRGSSLVGLSQAEMDACDEAERRERLETARQQYLGAGAHAVLEDMSALPGMIDRLNGLLAQGGGPDHA